MQGWNWKNWLSLAALLFCVWLILYIVEWNIRNGGTVSMGDALLTWLGDVVMLHWVKGYQELVAGCLALLAAFTVLLNSAIDHRRRTEERLADERDQLMQQLSALGFSFRTVSLSIGTKNMQSALTTVSAIEPSLGPISHAAPLLAQDILTAIAGIKIEIELLNKLQAEANRLPSFDATVQKRVEELSEPHRHNAMIWSSAIALYLFNPERLFGKSGRYEQSPHTIERTEESFLRGGNMGTAQRNQICLWLKFSD